MHWLAETKLAYSQPQAPRASKQSWTWRRTLSKTKYDAFALWRGLTSENLQMIHELSIAYRHLGYNTRAQNYPMVGNDAFATTI